MLEPDPGEIRLWSDTLVRALFADSTDAAHALAGLARALGPSITANARLRTVADQIWARAWLKDWKSMRFGARLWVCRPPPIRRPIPMRWSCRLDPGLAFGTGTHPTTALCLEALAARGLSGRSVVDYGCGSGILSIAALKLGAARVTAIDLDPQALLATAENAARNGVADPLTTQEPAAPLPTADYVLANILAGTLIELRPILTAATAVGGELLLSGILIAQAGSVSTAFGPWFDIVATTSREDWCCMRAIRRNS